MQKIRDTLYDILDDIENLTKRDEEFIRDMLTRKHLSKDNITKITKIYNNLFNKDK